MKNQKYQNEFIEGLWVLIRYQIPFHDLKYYYKKGSLFHH